MAVEVVVIDDQTIFRELLTGLLQADPNWSVLGQFDTGEEGLAHCLRTRPRVVILDVVLPDVSGLHVLARLREALPRTRVLLITAHLRPNVVREAMTLGASAILSKTVPLSELRAGLDRVRDGGTFYCSRSSEVVREASLFPSGPTQLTSRQQEILRRVALGQSTKQIASDLELSPRTVSNHRLHIMDRLGLRDIASLTRYAVELGLVEPSPSGPGGEAP